MSTRNTVKSIQDIMRQDSGDVYEQLLNDLQSAGNAGEFYTPRAVTAFMAERIDPRPGETLFDPACGTGGLITCAIRYMREKYVKTAEDEAALQSGLRGVEKKQLPHMLCTTNMLLHGIENPSFIRHDNTLARPYASIGTNLLFFEKGEPTQEVWFYEHRVPEGQKAYSMTRPIRLEHLQGCIDWWGGHERKGRQETEQAWRVSIDDIKARNDNLDFKNPHTVDEDHGDPEEILEKLNAAEGEACKRVEISVRSRWADEVGHQLSPQAYEDARHFSRFRGHPKTLQKLDDEIARSRETFITHPRPRRAD